MKYDMIIAIASLIVLGVVGYKTIQCIHEENMAEMQKNANTDTHVILNKLPL